MVTDNGWNYNGHSPFFMLGLNIKSAKQLSERVVLLPALNSQLSLSSEAPVFYRSYIGGFQKTNYFGNYLPFAGMKRMELNTDNVAYIALDLRIKLWQKIDTTLISNTGFYNNKTRISCNGKFIIGGGISVAYDSIVGPVEVIVSASNLNNQITRLFFVGILLLRSVPVFFGLNVQGTFRKGWLNIRVSKITRKRFKKNDLSYFSMYRAPPPSHKPQQEKAFRNRRLPFFITE